MNTFGLTPGQTPEPGIYLDMAPDIYYGCPLSLGSTDLKNLALNPVEWQYQRLHGEDKDTAALTWGKALHARTLEGSTALQTQFALAPDKADFPGCLVSHNDLKEHAKACGARKSSGTKAELIQYIREVDTTTVIWDELIGKFAIDNTGREILPGRVAAEVEQAAAWMQADPYLAPIMKDGTIVTGLSEVSIFYEDNGVRLKARLDHLMPTKNGHGVLDLKSFRSPRRMEIKRAVILAIGNERYDLQVASYMRALKTARKLFEDDKVFGGDAASMSLLKGVFDTKDDDLQWIWVFVKNHGAPEPLVMELFLKSFMFGASCDQIETAIESYRTMVGQYGLEQDWPPRHTVELLQDGDIPAYLIQ